MLDSFTCIETVAPYLSYAKKNLPKIKRNPAAYSAVGVPESFEALVQIYFNHWMDHLAAIESVDIELRLTQNGRLCELSYEDFSRDPAAHLTRVLAFMHVRDTGKEPVSLGGVDNRNYKVSDELTKQLVDSLTERGATTLERRGYTLLR